MTRICSFPPIAAAGARVLLLGSMPGEASLAAGCYYAHERNAFWPIMGSLLGFDPTLPYSQRVAAIQAADIAVWDVLQSCRRVGSLDANIEKESLVANDFPAFLAEHPRISHVFFNGGTAETCFRRHVLPRLDAEGLTFARLPSTSPANASYSLARKLAEWRIVLEPLS